MIIREKKNLLHNFLGNMLSLVVDVASMFTYASIKSKLQHPPIPPPRANLGHLTVSCARVVGNGNDNKNQ